MSLFLSRPEKLSHTDTARYEIYMLRHAIKRLAEQKLTGQDAWVYLEVFLLHYRNLIEFLGNENPRETDLHVTNIWKLTGLAEPPNLEEIYASGKVLYAQYEPKDDKHGGRISQYLHHITRRRIDAKNWDVATMMNEIEPLLCKLEKHLGVATGMLAHVPPVSKLTLPPASATVWTSTSVAAVDSEAPVKKRLKDFE